MVQNPNTEVIEAQIRECYGRVVWTHKTHEKCADLLRHRHDQIKLWQIILSAITTSGIFVAVFGHSREIGIFSAAISLILTIINTYVKNYDFGGVAQKHADAAASIWNIRESYLSLLADIRAGSLDLDQIRILRDKLQADLHKLYKGAPRTNYRAYSEASKALNEMEEMTFTDEEIDRFVPKEFRKTS